jgi:putative oxidoreductase
MKKYPPIIAGVLLGLLFIAAAIMALFNLVEAPPPPEGSPMALFFGAFAPTGYLTFVKVLELGGGLFVMIPRLRNLGLLILGPIVVNIIAFHLFIGGGFKDFLNPMLLITVLLSLYLLWVGRKKFASLLN